METTPETEIYLKLSITCIQLGFCQRIVDILQSVLHNRPDPEQQTQINHLLTTVQKHLNTENG